MTIDRSPPLLSIITIVAELADPAFKRTRASLQASIASPDVAWLIVPGSTPDKTLIDRLELGTATICHAVDAGIYPAMNTGLDAANGRYVWFMNGGDELTHPEVLTRILEACRDTQPDFIYGDALVMPSAGMAPQRKPARHHQSWRSGMFTEHQAMIYCTETIGDNRFQTRYPIAADYHFTIAHIQRSKRFLKLDHALCVSDPNGVSERLAKQGAAEQDMIRLHDFAVPPWRNQLVRLRQHCSNQLKQLAPKAWFWLRRHWAV
jgi:putative colanic acid biosynthesis glycosyltransferase